MREERREKWRKKKTRIRKIKSNNMEFLSLFITLFINLFVYIFLDVGYLGREKLGDKDE